MPRITRRGLLQGAAALGLADTSTATADPVQFALPHAPEKQEVSPAMNPYTGTPTSRIDGPAKVTGAAKYAAEFGTPDLAFGFVIELARHQGTHRPHQLQRSTAGARRARSTHA